MRVGERVIRALDDRQQGQFERHVAAFEFGKDVGQVALCTGKHAIQVIGVLREPLQLGRRAIVVLVGQLEAAAQLGQHVFGTRGRRGHFDARDRGIEGQRLFGGERSGGLRGYRYGKQCKKGDADDANSANSL